MEKTLKEFESSVNKLVQEFAKKQDFDFKFFVRDDYTQTACFGDILYFSLSDMYYDLKTKQPKGRITEWQEETLNDKDITYENYCLELQEKAKKKLYPQWEKINETQTCVCLVFENEEEVDREYYCEDCIEDEVKKRRKEYLLKQRKLPIDKRDKRFITFDYACYATDDIEETYFAECKNCDNVLFSRPLELE